MTGAEDRADLLLVCSSGGHLLQLLALRETWEGRSRIWVSEGTSDVRSLLAGERLVIAHWPAERSPTRLIRNTVLAWRLIGRVRPRLVMTTGAAVAVPFAWVARARGAKVVHVESVTRVETLSLSGRMIAPIADRLYVQWPELARKIPRARYVGAVFGTK